MPSSTSSSELREIPGGRWRATWLATIVLAVGLAGGFEALNRARGQRPTVVDDPTLWSLSRRQVEDDPRAVVFLGASRMALAYSARAFAAAAPGLHGRQLAIDGVPPLGVLRHLAEDDRFRGVAVVDILEWDVGVFDDIDSVRPWVERADALWRAPGAVANRLLATPVQARLASLATGSRRLLNALLSRRAWPRATTVVADADRISHADYTLTEPATLRARSESRVAGVGPPIPPDGWLALLARDFDPWIQRIRAHGGDVVIVHLPIDGALARLIDRDYPRAQYWDAYAARQPDRVLHFRDLPAMAGLRCPDDMHLDQRDQDAFTRALVEALRAHGVFRGREPNR